MKIIRTHLLAVVLFLPVLTFAQNIIPEPAQYRPAKGQFTLTPAENKAFEMQNIELYNQYR